MDINFQMFSDGIEVCLLSSPKRKRKQSNYNTPPSPPPPHYFVGRNLDQSLFQCLQISLVLFFSSALVGVTQSRAVVILIPPTNLQKVHITIQTLWFGLIFLMQVFKTSHEMR